MGFSNWVSKKISILLFDTNASDRKLIVDHLGQKDEAFTVVAVDSDKALFKHLKSRIPDIVISESRSLELSTKKLLESVKKLHPKLPIVLTTIDSSLEKGINAMKMGASDYILKSENFHVKIIDSVLSILSGKEKAEVSTRNIIENVSTRNIIENDRKENDNNFRDLFEYSPVGKSMTGLDGSLFVNKAFCDILGYSKEEFQTINWKDITFPDDMEKSNAAFTELLQGKIKIAKYQKRYFHKNGQIVWADISTYLRRDQDNNPKYFITSISDITERKNIERSLELSEWKHRIVAENTYDWEFWMDTNDQFIYCSPSCLRITGYQAKEFMDDPSLMFRIIHPDDIKNYWHHRKITSFISDPVEINFKIIHADGSARWIGHVCQTILDNNGNSLGRRGSNRDITLQVKADESLKKSEARFRSYFEFSIAGIAITSPAATWIEVNDHICTMLGYTRDELFKSKWTDLTYPDDIALDLNHFNRVLKGELDGYTIEKRFIRKDGNIIWTSLSVKCIRQSNGLAEYFMALLIDITDRKKMEEKLVWEQYLMHALLDNIPDYIYFKDLESRYLRINKSLANRLGIEDPALAIGKKESDFIHTSHTVKSFKDEQEIIRTGLPIIAKSEIFTAKDHSMIWVSSTKMALTDSSRNLIGTFGISRDITEKRKMVDELIKAKEKAEENDRLKTAFLQNISHEIRTPLNAIVGFSSLMGSKDVPSEKRKEFMQVILASNDQLVSIISGIISLASLNAGQEKIKEEETNINDLISNIYEQLKINKSSKDVHFSFQTGNPDHQAKVITDPVKLAQILINLVGNALKFTHKGHVKFGYRLVKGLLAFYVEDTGIGIPKEYQEVIFERFRQVDSSPTRKYGGTGLGLALSKGYAELLGGIIKLKSMPGVGSIFSFEIPYKPVKADMPEKQIDQDIQKSVFSKGNRILIADDDVNNSMLLTDLLAPLNLSIQTVSNGLEAVRACFNGNTPDIILMDIMMPVMDGIKATKEIKKKNPEIHVIALTACALEQEKSEILKSGCDAFVEKPIKLPVLLETIKRFLDLKGS
jgi:PAS domain S-box-containing protein